MSGRLRFDCFEVDVAAHRLLRRGARVRLRHQSFEVLSALLEHPGEVVTREGLRQRLWSGGVFVDFENSLNTAVARLREALGDSADQPRYIETLARVGYRFMGSVSESHDAPASSARRAKARLMVLPFVNSSGDPSQEYFSDAITDEIITELAALAPADLGVIARTTAMHYKATGKDIAEIARELSLDWVVEGAARRSEDQAALTAQLIRASDQTHVFGKRYDVDVRDVFRLEQSVARALGREMGIVHPDRPSTTEGHVRRPTDDLVAYNDYIRGRHYFERATSPHAWREARECLERATARDPLFALAHDALAELWWTTGFFAVIPPKDALMAGLPHAEKAVEIDGQLAEAHAMLAQYRKQLDFDWAEVEREMSRALDLNPRSPIVRSRRAVTGLMPFGRLNDAVADLEIALELDPIALFPMMWLAIMCCLRRDFDRAIDQARLLIEIEPAHFASQLVMGIVCREAGRFPEALHALCKARDSSGGAPLVIGWLGLALAESGNQAGARALLNGLNALPPGVYMPPTSLAWIHLGLGEIDAFFDWMERAIDARDHMITPIQTYPFLDCIRDDPRYVGLLRRMRLTSPSP